MSTSAGATPRGVRRGLVAAALAVALGAVGAPVAVGAPDAEVPAAEPAAAAVVGTTGSTTGAAVYASGTGSAVSANRDSVAWLSWGEDKSAIASAPGAATTVENWHQVSETERVEVTCTLTAKSTVVLSNTFDNGGQGTWKSRGDATLSVVDDPTGSGKSLKGSGMGNGNAPVIDLTSVLKPGSTYQLSFRARLANSGSSGAAHFTVYEKGTSGGEEYTWASDGTSLRYDQWTTIEGTYTLASAVQKVEMYLGFAEGGPYPDTLIDDVTITGQGSGDVIAYKPGTYAGDGLVQLYPGIAPVGVKQVADTGSFSFTVACSGELVEYDGNGWASGNVVDTRSVNLGGMVFADPESTRTGEHIAATPHEVTLSSSPWIQIDKFNGGCVQNGEVLAKVDSGTWRIELSNPGQECGNGGTPNGVVLAQGVSALDVTVVGGGQSAAAIGYVLAADYGDAPRTFGVAGALLQPTWTGPTLTAGNWYLAGYTGANQNCHLDRDQMVCSDAGKLVTGYVATAQQPAVGLGTTTAGNDSVPFSSDATGDAPDEDAFGTDASGNALAAPDVEVRPGVAAYGLTTATCRGGDGVSAAAWIDWNSDGTFSLDERSGVKRCPSTGTAVTLTWSKDVSVTLPASGKTFLRLRVSTTEADLDSATGAAISGEVEDWQVTIRAPRLSVTKTADQATVPDAGATVGYTVTVTNTGTLDFTDEYPAYLLDDASAAADDAALGAVSVAPSTAAAASVVGSRISWFGPLAAKQSVTLTYGMTVSASPTNRVMTNVVRVAPDVLIGTLTCDSADASRPCARVDLYAVGLTVQKRAYDATAGTSLASGSTLVSGTRVRWDYVVTNTGSAPLRDVTVTDEWAETRDVGAVASSGFTTITCPGAASEAAVTIPELAAGASVTCTATKAVVPGS